MVGRISSPTLVDRAEELARLEQALAEARAGRPATVLVSGEAGVGKSRLINEFVVRASSTGASVLTGGCVALTEGELAFAPLVEALRGFLQQLGPAAVTTMLAEDRNELARLLPELGQIDSPGPDRGLPGEAGQARLFGLLQRLLGRLGGDAPVVLVIEDLQWTDHSTLAFLSYLLRSLRAERLLLVVSFRSDELPRTHPVRGWLAEQHRGGRMEELELRRFSRAELGEQLSGIIGPAASKLLSDIYARSEGNPFFAEELVASSDRDGRAELPSRLRDVLLLRTSSCSPTAQVVLRVAAATGRRVDERLLAAVAPLPESELLTGLREAVDHQLLVVRPDEDVYEFRHALLQEAVYGELLPGERGRLHAALATILTERLDSGELDWSASAAEIAVHWYRAHTWPSALEWSVRAAVEADQMHAYAEGVRHYERALELWDRVPDARVRTGVDRAEVLERAAEAGRMSGDSGHALALIERALQEIDPMVEPVRAGLLHERRGEYLMSARDLNSRFEALREAVRLVPIVPPSRERARVLASFADALALAGLEEEARVASEEAIEIARPIGAERELGYALVVLGWSQATRGALEAGIASLREACRLGEKHSDPELARRAYGWLGEELMQSSRLEEAVNVLLSGREVLRRLGAAGYRPDTYLSASAADALLKLGRWDEADKLARRALAQAQPDDRLPFVVLAMLEISRGEFEAAEAHLKVIEGRMLTGMPEGARMILSAMAELRIWQGRLDEARTAISEGLDRVAGTDEARSGRLICLGMRAEADRAERGRAHRDQDGVDEAIRAAEALVSRVATMAPNPLVSEAAAVPSTTAVTAQWEGERTRLAGRSDPARWSAAAEAWLALRRPYPAAYAQWRQAEALLYQREPVSRAVAPLQAAHATALRLGARPLLAEIESLARRARITLEVPQVETEAVASSPVAHLGLTDRELEVLRLLAAGRSNREIGEALFISAKTASVHISNIFRKLDVTSRIQAAAVAHRLGLVEKDLSGA